MDSTTIRISVPTDPIFKSCVSSWETWYVDSLNLFRCLVDSYQRAGKDIEIVINHMISFEHGGYICVGL